ncbi:MAG TPA: penicillin-binding protein 2, partial [Desulfosalsimonadaceae bacterium]|nr:penicillin-binding protein 2 [Desulfosalsimonadaceae bacterium]
MAASSRLQKYLQAIDADWYRSRFLVLVFFVLAAFSLLSIQLLHLQIIKGSRYRQLSQDNCIRKKRVKAFRGLIYDREGRILVENRPSFNLMMVEKDAEPLEKTALRLAGFIDREPAAILEKLRRDSGGPYDPVLIQEDMDRNTMAAVAAHRFE